MLELTKKQRKGMLIIIAYPLVLIIIATLLNVFAFGSNPVDLSLPSREVLTLLIIASVLLVVNHTWLMTATELVRVRYKMYATPEEWLENGLNKKDTPEVGFTELERVHNAHRNTTENTLYFILLSTLFILSSPTQASAMAWLIGFPVARLGYTYSYLSGKDNVRGLFMTLSLIAIYGLASYNLINIL